MQADLPRLVDDPHPAAGDLPGEEIVAEGPRPDLARPGRAGRLRPRAHRPSASPGFGRPGRSCRDRPIQPGRIQPREAFAVVAGLAVLAERTAVVELEQDQLGQQGERSTIRRVLQKVLDPRPLAALPGQLEPRADAVQMPGRLPAPGVAESNGDSRITARAPVPTGRGSAAASA